MYPGNTLIVKGGESPWFISSILGSQRSLLSNAEALKGFSASGYRRQVYAANSSSPESLV